LKLRAANRSPARGWTGASGTTSTSCYGPCRERREEAGELKSRIGLGDLIRGEVRDIRLTRAGGNLVALCPLCGQKRTPSFYVYDGDRFHCHACDRGGDHFDFLREFLPELDQRLTPSVRGPA